MNRDLISLRNAAMVISVVLLLIGVIYQDITWHLDRDYDQIWDNVWEQDKGHIITHQVTQDAYGQSCCGIVKYTFQCSGREFTGRFSTQSFRSEGEAASAVQRLTNKEQTQGFTTVYHDPESPLNNSLIDAGPKMGLPYGFLAAAVGFLLISWCAMPEDAESFLPGRYRALVIGSSIGIPLGLICGTIKGWGITGNWAALLGYAGPIVVCYLWWMATGDRKRTAYNTTDGWKTR